MNAARAPRKPSFPERNPAAGKGRGPGRPRPRERLDEPERLLWIRRTMRAKATALATMLCLLALTAGCYSTVEGRTKVGIPFVRDKIVSRYERPVSQVFKAAKEVLAFNGTLVGENTIANTLTAKVDNSTVWVKVEEVEPGVTQVATQARTKGSGGDITLASEIDKQIALRLTTME